MELFSENDSVGWGAIFLSLGLAVVAIMKTYVESHNARQDRRQSSADAQQERLDKIYLDERLLELKRKSEECDRKHADCEAARLVEAEKTTQREKEHHQDSLEWARAIEALQKRVGIPVSIRRPRKPKSSTSLPKINVIPKDEHDKPEQLCE